jgi:hypothetical protein
MNPRLTLQRNDKSPCTIPDDSHRVCFNAPSKIVRKLEEIKKRRGYKSMGDFYRHIID